MGTKIVHNVPIMLLLLSSPPGDWFTVHYRRHECGHTHRNNLVMYVHAEL